MPLEVPSRTPLPDLKSLQCSWLAGPDAPSFHLTPLSRGSAGFPHLSLPKEAKEVLSFKERLGTDPSIGAKHPQIPLFPFLSLLTPCGLPMCVRGCSRAFTKALPEAPCKAPVIFMSSFAMLAENKPKKCREEPKMKLGLGGMAAGRVRALVTTALPPPPAAFSRLPLCQSLANELELFNCWCDGSWPQPGRFSLVLAERLSV